jgi:hypothetical protein
MITYKMTCVIESIMPSQCFSSVNLSNYGHMCLKLLHLNVLSPNKALTK